MAALADDSRVPWVQRVPLASNNDTVHAVAFGPGPLKAFFAVGCDAALTLFGEQIQVARWALGTVLSCCVFAHGGAV
eukprot:CAMPEP_0119285284 /NCGR_PEP_ID=MMETSP1329-20130426/31904_1 /TAXON_ID=114041 /ORGANISM="Genus nov. species nov., Strain RCC1024" /LENGTH=76 /DNA_ID=CAMNT_0007285991 /DNA_START=240 /DNA_END=467 /DNA_ORIENTATION=-